MMIKFFNQYLENKKTNKFFLFNWLFFIFLFFVFFLSLYHSWEIVKNNESFIIFKWFYFLSFSKYNLFSVLIIVGWTIFRIKNKILDFLALFTLVGLIINTLFFRSFIRDWNIYPSQSNNFMNLIIYFLEYFFVPFFFFLFYRINNFKIFYKMIYWFFIYPLFFFLLYFSLTIFNQNIKDLFYTELFIKISDKKNFYFSYLKIFLAFFILNLVLVFFLKNKENLILRIFFCFVLFIVATIQYDKNDWLHAKKVFFKNGIMGSGLFPESQEISEYFQKISSLNNQELKNENGKILELGAGTGNVTQYLIDKFGVENIIAIEIEEELCLQLKKRFPNLIVIHGNAVNFEKLIRKYTQNAKIKGIVSTLPIGIFSEKDFQKLKESIEKIVQNNNINYMYYRFKLFEKEKREMTGIQKKSNFIFISEMFMPVSVYLYIKN